MTTTSTTLKPEQVQEQKRVLTELGYVRTEVLELPEYGLTILLDGHPAHSYRCTRNWAQRNRIRQPDYDPSDRVRNACLDTACDCGTDSQYARYLGDQLAVLQTQHGQLHAAALALVQVDEHRAWLETHPLGSDEEQHDLFGPRFHSAYSVLAALVQPSAASAGAAASGGAEGVRRDDTPERSSRQELVSADGQVYASVEVEADAEGHPVPVGLTVHRGVLLEAYGEDEADVVLALSRAEARALAGGLEAAARVESGSHARNTP